MYRYAAQWLCYFVVLFKVSAMDNESCHVFTAAASHLKEGVLGLRVTLGDNMFGLFDSSPDVVLYRSESDGEGMIMVVENIPTVSNSNSQPYLNIYPYLLPSHLTYLPYL
jgi:hypothetical protein